MSLKYLCPSGHYIEKPSMSTTVTLSEPHIDSAIVFTCPGGKHSHSFNLRQAIDANMFLEEEAGNIRQHGRQYRALYAKAGSR